MTSTPRTAEEHCCLSCGRRITSAASIAAGRGSGCRAKLRSAAKAADLSEWTPRQVEPAVELISDGGVVPTARPGVFRTVSTDGSAVYMTSASWCGCAAGLKAKACYHRCAVAIVLATSAAAAATPAAPAAETTSADIWSELDRLNEAFMAAA